jgi:pimeloyl-ACP methyl ester carboxylesterase
MSPRRLEVSSGEVRLYVEAWGEGGLPLVLAHGFGGSARNFRPQARELCADRMVVLFDARGHARSDAPTDPRAYAPARFVGDIERVLDSLGIERAVVGGLSMGAGVALRFALSRPDRVAATVLSAFPRTSDDLGHVEWAHAFAAAIERDGIDEAGRAHAWGSRMAADPHTAGLVRRGLAEHSRHGLALTLRHLIAVQPSPQRLETELRALSSPMLVVVGSKDAPSLGPSRALCERVSGAQLLEIPAGGHVINLEKRREYNEVLRAFLARLPSTS